ncbi:MAG: enoyl-CoA hydratase/isomerase family protein [Gemmatimonadota bacterium]
MSPRSEPVLCQRDGPVATIVLNRPERLNAVSLSLYQELERTLGSIEAAPEIRAVVVTGSGRAFSAGADLVLHDEEDADEEARRAYAEAAQQAFRRLHALPRPIVAAVHGPAIGAGLELAIACDLVVVARDARLRFPELALGTFVGGGTVATLTERVGLSRAKELLLLGSFFSGEEAGAWGLVNRVVESQQVLEVAQELARELAARAPVPIAFAKRLIERARHLDTDQVMTLETEALLACMRTRDWREGIKAFREKRPPRFRGE